MKEKKKLEEKLEEKRANRISIRKRLPKVNQKYAERLLSKAKKDLGDLNDDDDNVGCFLLVLVEAMGISRIGG